LYQKIKAGRSMLNCLHHSPLFKRLNVKRPLITTAFSQSNNQFTAITTH
jgi:hypothetical protein